MLEPVQQWKAKAADDAKLRKVDVRVNETGQQEARGHVALGGRRIGFGERLVFARGTDAAIGDKQCAVGDVLQRAFAAVRPGGSLSPAELANLHQAIRAVLADGIAYAGSSLGTSGLQNYSRPGGQPGGFQAEHRVFRRTGKPCLVCTTPIERIVVAQRSTHFCPVCQH